MTLRLRAVGGIVGPTGFVAAWVIGGAVQNGYSPVADAISRLAAVGATSRPLMTSGFAVFGAGLVTYATVLRRCVGGAAWMMAAVTGVSTVAVALAPLDQSSTVDALHAVFAGIGYTTLALTPLLAARPLLRRGHVVLARFGIVAGGIAAVSLALTTTGLPTGLFQRIGLSAGDAWIIVSSVAILTDRLRVDHGPLGGVGT